MFRKLQYLTVLSLLSFAFSSCGSKKTSSVEEVEEYPAAEETAASAQDIVLNGDSDSGRAGGLRTVYFEFNSSSLSTGARDALDNNAAFLKSNPAVEVQVEGHADERGGIQYNLALGEKRAKAVRQHLSNMGVSASRVSVVSYGKERPLEFGHTESSWSKNRRANFVVTAK